MRIRATRSVLNKMHRKEGEIKFSAFRGSGAGGQNRNKRDTAVRLTDTITGITAEAQEHRTQGKNKEAAFERLVQRLQDHYEKEEKEERLSRIKQKTERIRTYNEKRNTVTCDITGNAYPLDDVLDGKLTKMIQNILLEKVEGQNEVV